ncbi:MAG: hypothetical protein K1Y36_22090, partial [Blastocatellia bacterium]|nr:hypothetical protein [Blastocatellia bacterium]
MDKQALKFGKARDEQTKQANIEHASNVFFQLLGLVPDEKHEILIEIMSDEARLEHIEETRLKLAQVIASLDLQGQREEIVRLLMELIPVEDVVPTIYEKYRPMVIDAAKVIFTHLSAERLQNKLVDQLVLPLEASLQERILMLIARMPTLQKLGQIIARNKNLDPEFRRRLQRLENGIRDVTFDAIKEKVQDELKRQLTLHEVKLGRKLLAEASVCAVMPFTFRDDEGAKKRGVFKVLKPFIAGYWAEELKILEKLAEFLDRNRANYGLPTIGFKEILKEVRELLKREVKLSIEQGRLQEANDFYAGDDNVRVPQLLHLRTKTVTGMEFLEGEKVTSAAVKFPAQRKRIAELVLDKLILAVLFHEKEHALFHADPHAGNVFYSVESDELVLFDWGLSCTLSREIRRELVQLILGFILNEPERTFKATCNLTVGKISPLHLAAVEKRVQEIFADLPLFPLIRLEPLTRLLDELILDGVRFPSELLMFRKSLFTLLGVVHDVDPEFNTDLFVTRMFLGQIVSETPQRLRKLPWSRNYPSQISTWELRHIVVRLSVIAARLGLMTTQLLAELGVDWATQGINSF